MTTLAVRLQEITALITDGKHGDCSNEVDSGYFFISSKDIREGKIDYSDARQITKSDFEETHRRTRLEQSDILITNSGTIGRMAFVEKTAHTSQTTFQKSVAIIKPNSKVVDPKFLYFTLLANKYHLIELAGGTAQKNLLLGDLRAFRIVLPEYQSQLKIASILSAYDDLIENNKRRIAILEKMAEEIYREWFVRMRFSSYAKATEDKPAESSPAGLPLGWSYLPIGEAVKFTGGGTPSTTTPDFWTDGDINWFTPTDITGAEGIFLDESSEKCTDLGVRHSSATMFPAYSLMMTSRATIGAIAINTKPACTNQGFITCIPNTRYTLPYLYHWLKLNKSYFEQISSGSTFLELIKSRFKKIPILTAPQSVMTRYTELSQPIFNQVEKLLAANKVLKKTRDLLLPRLISGKLSVEDLELPTNEKQTAVGSALPQQELAHA